MNRGSIIKRPGRPCEKCPDGVRYLAAVRINRRTYSRTCYSQVEAELWIRDMLASHPRPTDALAADLRSGNYTSAELAEKYGKSLRTIYQLRWLARKAAKTLGGAPVVTKTLGGAPVVTKRKTHNEVSAKVQPVSTVAPAPREQEVQQGLPFVKSCKDYRYVKRSCNNCVSAKSCPSIVGKDFRLSWLDLARCGCLHYNGPHIMERPISRS